MFSIKIFWFHGIVRFSELTVCHPYLNLTCRNEYNFAVLELEHPVPVNCSGLAIGSKFDTDIHSNTCRIAFKGNILKVYDNQDFFTSELHQLKVFKSKKKVETFNR